MTQRTGAVRPAHASAREQTHRRVLLIAVGTLILLGLLPVFGHHLAAGLERFLAGKDHLGPICLIALHALLAPIHFLFHALVVAGLLYALWDRMAVWRASRAVLAALDARRPTEGDPFWAAARTTGADPRRVRVVAGLPNPAFTVGAFRPRIYVAGALAERLSAEELAAVLAHEEAHARRRDPLRLGLLRFLAHALFWIPALRRLADDVADDAEIQADDHAARDRPLALASALLALAGWLRPPVTTGEGVGFAQRTDLLDRRIRRLAGQHVPAQSHVNRRSLIGAALALALVWTSGVVMAHPLPNPSHVAHTAHCEHDHAPATAHLFCLGLRPQPDPACPHAG